MSTKDKLLSLRLEAIYNLIQEGESVADIGTDHGYIPVALALSQKSPTIYAVDNKKGPLSQAQKMVDFYGVQASVTCTLVKKHHAYHDVDVWVIAGMGYEVIKDIILTHFATIKKLKKVIVQVNHQVIEFREFCMKHHLHIIQEIVVEDGYIYPIMVISYQDEPINYSEKDLVVGPILQHQSSLVQQKYYHQKHKHLLQVLAQIPSDNPRYELLKKHLHFFESVLEQ